MTKIARAPGRRGVEIVLAGILAVLAGCGGGSSSSAAGGGAAAQAATEAAAEPAVTPLAALGGKIFADTSLSASGRQSCASCHDPLHGHAPGNALAVQPGGVLLELQGTRSTPSIRYLATNTPFFFDAAGTPTGGFFWDGRAKSLQDQAGRPFLEAREMANGSKAEVVDKLARAAYARDFEALFGAGILGQPDAAFDRMTLALQAFQKQDAALRPFSSKYDAVLLGTATLTAQESRGLALFNAPSKGNCAGCHPSARGPDGALPLFTDFTYDAIGVPRNPDIAANADASHYDLGLCARQEGDLAARRDLCGAFKVPSLRNVAQRQAYFHNGRFKTLKEALTFYVQRDTNPEKWYWADADGNTVKFDDLPPALRGNVNTTEAPYNRRPGDAPALSDGEIDDVIAFLRTLDDGFSR